MTYTKEQLDGTVIYSASSIGYCSAALYWDRLGVTHEAPPENIRKAWAEGNDNEQRIIDMLASQKVFRPLNYDMLVAEGYTFGEYMPERNQDYSKQVRVEKRAGNVIIRAHLDGIGRVTVPAGLDNGWDFGQKAVIEAKAFGDSYWSKWQSGGLAAFPTYEWQCSIQMHGTGLPMVFVVGKKNKNGVVDFIETQLVTEPPISWGKIAAKVARIEKAVAENKVPACEEPIMYPCPFYTRHQGPEVDAFGQPTSENLEFIVEGQRATTLKILVERYEAHKKHEAEHKREADVAKETILSYFTGDDGLPSDVVVVADGVKFKAKPGGRKGSLQEAKLKEAGLNPDDFRGKPSNWLSVEVISE